METVKKPTYNKTSDWNVTVVTDEKDVMIRFYLLRTSSSNGSPEGCYSKQIYGTEFD